MIKESAEQPMSAPPLPVDSVICGDALEVLRGFEDNVFDAIVCDPPAGIDFMNLAFDSNRGGRDQWITWLTSIMREAMRTLKPGGSCLVWALPRTSHWTATALENAGFEIRDVIHHLYSADTALQRFLASLTSEQQEAFERLIDSQASSVLYHLFGSGFPKSLDVSKAIDVHLKVEREVVGVREDIKGGPGTAIGSLQKAMKEHGARKYAEGLSHDNNVTQYGGVPITAPATDAAKQWSGFGTNLKPAAEHWILVRKPLSERSIAENVLRWGCGALNIDASRVISGQDYEDMVRVNAHKFGGVSSFVRDKEKPGFTPDSTGRWPSHLLLSHSLLCTDDQCVNGCPVLALDQQSGTRKSGYMKPGQQRQRSDGGYMGNFPETATERGTYGDQGTASRYFAQFRTDVPPFYYASKASRKEREAGCEALPAQQGFDKNTSKVIAHINHETGQATYAEYSPSSNHNHHPTVKSLSLMNYLVRLCCPPNGIILDPFCGSGSTLVACVQQGFHFAGIDQSLEYVEIARARIAHAQKQTTKTKQ